MAFGFRVTDYKFFTTNILETFQILETKNGHVTMSEIGPRAKSGGCKYGLLRQRESKWKKTFILFHEGLFIGGGLVYKVQVRL